MIKKVGAQIKTQLEWKKKIDQVLISHGTHLSLTNPTLTPFVILVLIYGWGEKVGGIHWIGGSKCKGLKL